MSPQTPPARWVWMTESHASAVWVAFKRLEASAARNLAEEGDAEGDDDWRDLLENLHEAWEVADAVREANTLQAITHLEATLSDHCCTVGSRGECLTRKGIDQALACLRGEPKEDNDAE